MSGADGRPTNEAMALLDLLRAIVERMEAQRILAERLDKNLTALTGTVGTLNEILVRWARLAQELSGAKIKDAEEQRKSDLLQDLSNNLFDILGGTRKKSAKRRRTR